MTQFTRLADRVGGAGADAWEVHYAALKRQRQGENMIILSIGQEMSETTPQPIVEAAFDSLNNSRHHYSEVSGEPDLKEMLAVRYSKLWQKPVSPANIAVLSGAQNALFSASLCTLQAGDEVIIIEPYYATYPATFSVGGAKVVTVSTLPENNFLPSIDDVVQKLASNTRAIVINSPHNPSGMVYPDDFLIQLVEICKSRNIWLISDEVYTFFAPPEGIRSPAALPGAFEHCITVSSVSKSHRMTGWRVGWIVASEPVIERVFNLALCMSYGLPMFTQDAACAALAHSETIEPAVRQDVDRKRNQVVSFLDQINGIVVRGSQVGMFVTFDVRQLAVTANDFAWRLLDDYRVAVLPCSAFGSSGAGILRINIGDTNENLRIACESIRDLVFNL